MTTYFLCVPKRNAYSDREGKAKTYFHSRNPLPTAPFMVTKMTSRHEKTPLPCLCVRMDVRVDGWMSHLALNSSQTAKVRQL